jgi:hypothetical protein
MTFTFEPDETGTTLTLLYELDTKVPGPDVFDGLLDRASCGCCSCGT